MIKNVSNFLFDNISIAIKTLPQKINFSFFANKIKSTAVVVFDKIKDFPYHYTAKSSTRNIKPLAITGLFILLAILILSTFVRTRTVKKKYNAYN